MTTLFRYKGYTGSIEIDINEKHLFGQLLHIRDLVTYEAETLATLEQEFKNSVDDYLAVCEEQGIDPAKPCTGSFNIRIRPEQHESLALLSRLQQVSINELVKQAVTDYLEKSADQLEQGVYTLGD